MNDGFIKIYRSLLDWEWYQSGNTVRVFLHLLLNANWEDSRFQGYEVPKGSLVTSYKSISTDLGISIKSVRVAMNHLKMTGEVAIKGHSHFSIVTITNWEKFQGYKDDEGNQNGTQGAFKGQTKGNIKEIKNIRIKEYNKSPFDANKGTIKANYDFETLQNEIRNK